MVEGPEGWSRVGQVQVRLGHPGRSPVSLASMARCFMIRSWPAKREYRTTLVPERRVAGSHQLGVVAVESNVRTPAERQQSIDAVIEILQATARRTGGSLDLSHALRVSRKKNLPPADFEDVCRQLRGEGLMAEEAETAEPRRAGHQRRKGVSVDAVDCFFAAAAQHDVLSLEGERALARAIAYGRDARQQVEQGLMDDADAASIVAAGQRATQQLILANLRLVPWATRSMRCDESRRADLLQQGVLGLERAARYYDLERGARFSTYATWWIFQFAMAFLYDQVEVVRVPRYLREAQGRMRRARARLYAQGIVSPGEQIERLAEELGEKREKVALLLALDAKPVSLSTTAGDDEHDLATRLEDESIEEPGRSLDMEDLRSAVTRCMSSLSERQQVVVRMRFGLDGEAPLTLEQVGDRLGVTRERVRQIQAKALERLRVREHSKILEAFVETAA